MSRVSLFSCLAMGVIVSTMYSSVLLGREAKDPYVAFHTQDYELAELGFRKKQGDEPNNYRHSYNLGVSLYQQHKFEEALQAFAEAARTEDISLRSRALYNQGLSQIMQGQLDSAQSSLQEALSYDLGNPMIQENLQWVNEQIQNQPSEESSSDEDQKNNEAGDESQPMADQSEGQDEQEAESQDQGGEELAEQGQDEQEAEPQDEGGEELAEQGQDEQKSQSQDEGSEELAEQGQDEGSEDLAEQGQDEGGEDTADQGQDEEQSAKANQSSDMDSGDDGQDEHEPETYGELDDEKGESSAEKGREDRILTAEEMAIQDAERLIRSLEDRVGRFYLPVDPEKARRRGDDNAW